MIWGIAFLGLCVALFLMFGGVIGSEFLPHLDEGALWVRGTLASSTGPSEGIRVSNQARSCFALFPKCLSAPARWGVRMTARIPPASSIPNTSST